MKIKILIYLLLVSYLATFLRILINNNFIVSIVGSFFLGFVIEKNLSNSKEKMQGPKKGKVMRQKEYEQRALATYSVEGLPKRG